MNSAIDNGFFGYFVVCHLQDGLGQSEPKSRSVYVNTVGMKFVKVPAGRFMMGDERIDMSSPIHEVAMSSFWMDAYEVTNTQFERFQKHRRGAYSLGDHNPVTEVTHEEAIAYAKWLSKKEGLDYRLPTEAQWEYAARGGLKGKDYPWGNEDPHGRAVPSGLKTSKGGTFPPNGYGLYDMAGNVAEFVYESLYDYKLLLKVKKDPVGPSVKGGDYLTRGGGVSSFDLIVWLRELTGSGERMPAVGFRLALLSNPKIKSR